MKNSGEVILSDIDSTLDQLIRNADAMNRIKDRRLFTNEVKAMHKTQESLIARLMHMHELYENEKKTPEEQKPCLTRIENKLSKFGRLNAQMIAHLESGVKQRKVSVRARRRKTKRA
jgi:hypothetical protein